MGGEAKSLCGGAPVGGEQRAFMAPTKVHNLYLQQQVRETEKGSNSICRHIHQNNTNNLNSKPFRNNINHEKEVDMNRQVCSVSDLKFKRIPPRRSQSDEQVKQNIKQHNLSLPVQIKSTPMIRYSVESVEVHVWIAREEHGGHR